MQIHGVLKKGMKRIFETIPKISFLQWCKVLFVDTLITVFVASCTSYFWLVPVCLVMMLILTCALFAIKKYFTDFDKLCILLASSIQYPHKIKNQILTTRNSKVIPCFSIIVILYFGTMGLLLLHTEILSFNLLVILLHFIVCVFVSMIGYALYFELPRLLFLIKKSQKVEPLFPYGVPAKTDWVISASKLCNFYNLCFLGVGALFIIAFAFYTFSPYWGVPEAKQTSLGYLMNILCWVVIFIAIGIVLPAVNIYEWYCLKHCIEQIKEQQLGNINRHISLIGQRGYSTENYYGLLHYLVAASSTAPPNNFCFSLGSFVIWLGSAIGSFQVIIQMCPLQIG